LNFNHNANYTINKAVGESFKLNSLDKVAIQ